MPANAVIYRLVSAPMNSSFSLLFGVDLSHVRLPWFSAGYSALLFEA
jgi:hypothetical protein